MIFRVCRLAFFSSISGYENAGIAFFLFCLPRAMCDHFYATPRPNNLRRRFHSTILPKFGRKLSMGKTSTIRPQIHFYHGCTFIAIYLSIWRSHPSFWKLLSIENIRREMCQLFRFSLDHIAKSAHHFCSNGLREFHCSDFLCLFLDNKRITCRIGPSNYLLTRG